MRKTTYIRACLAAILCCSGHGIAISKAIQEKVVTQNLAPQRGMWIWHMEKLLGDGAAQSRLFAATTSAGITDLYIYLPLDQYAANDKKLSEFIEAAHEQKITVSGVDGCRCYFTDADGPAGLYAAIDALIAYNRRVEGKARFDGFQNISLPHDVKGYRATFHNGVRGSHLNKTGDGVWKASAAKDRQAILTVWLDMQKAAHRRLQLHGLNAAVAMLSSTESYYGEPMRVSYEGSLDSIGRIMMKYADDFIVLTYNTDPENAASRVSAQAAYASSLPAKKRPRVLAAIETDPGNGDTISYGDTPGKKSQAAVLNDILRVEQLLRDQPSFMGVGIHSWEGWQLLADKD